MSKLDKYYKYGIVISIAFGVFLFLDIVSFIVGFGGGNVFWCAVFFISLALTILLVILQNKMSKTEEREYELEVKKEQEEIDKFCEIEEVGSKIEDIERNNKDYVLSVKEVKSVGQRNNRCPSCGSQTNGDYCEHCGRKVVDYTKSLTYKLYGCTKEYRFVNGRLVDAIVNRR